MTMGSHAASVADFTVTILASGVYDAGIVYVVAVTQPVQSWTVLRCHDDFLVVSQSLALLQSLHGLPPCPPIRRDDRSVMIESTNELQQWLSYILMYPGARDSMAIRNFLTLNANTILPQYEGVAWAQFAAGAAAAAVENERPVVDDMDMDDMFFNNYYAADETTAQPQTNEEEEDDDDYIQPASVRYKPSHEAVTDQDEFDMMNGDVEMIEDIGSLAQSLGASHLGQSLKLQADRNPISSANSNKGLNIVGGGFHTAVSSNNPKGGIGGAMEAAGDGHMDKFHRKPLESAARLDSFKMIRVIGKGSFGKVFLVREIKTATIYALKVLRKDNIIKRNQVEHTKTERSVLGYVKHPFIVGMNMAFQSKDKLYFVLDYCAGGELFFHLGKEGRFPEARARFYAAEIILAISYVHSLDIIYRDLKPENVLLDAKGHIRLTDFGLSKEGINSSSSGANSFCGTPEYLAPEILNRQGHGRAVDWWSLGALLYEMLTGLPPFYCQDRERLFEKIRKSELSYPPSVSRPAVNVLKGLLTKDPTRRLGSGPSDAEDIKVHDFFSSISWDKLMMGEVSPPWRPTITGALDTSQFDKEFTNIPVFSPHSKPQAHGFGLTPNDSHFEGFTFTDRILHGAGAQG